MTTWLPYVADRLDAVRVAAVEDKMLPYVADRLDAVNVPAVKDKILPYVADRLDAVNVVILPVAAMRVPDNVRFVPSVPPAEKLRIVPTVK